MQICRLVAQQPTAETVQAGLAWRGAQGGLRGSDSLLCAVSLGRATNRTVTCSVGVAGRAASNVVGR